jgi:hypothetical protein
MPTNVWLPTLIALLLAWNCRAISYESDILPILTQYCYGCHGNGKHKGDIALDKAVPHDEKLWDRVLQMLERQEMPPSNKPQPSNEQRQLVTKWIDSAVFGIDCDRPNPGRVTIRRLNRSEYNNTIRDLLGVNFRPADDFPVDDSGHGFDNIGDVLSMPPLLVEKYLATADRIIAAAISRSVTNRYPVDALELGYNAKQRGDGWVSLNSTEEDDVAIAIDVPATAGYRLRVRAYATNIIKLTFMLDQHPVKMVEITSNSVYEAGFTAPPGRHRFRAVVRRNKDGLPEAEALKWKSGPNQKGTVFVHWLEMEGPFRPPTLTLPSPKHAKEFLRTFATRAYRRPVTRQELDRLARLGNDDLTVALRAILVSPHFLYRGETTIDDYALASRLSYFLWSSMPDDELFEHARKGTLRKNLEKQVRRMLADPKASALTENFAGQWLQIRNLASIGPDRKTFPQFDEPLRHALRKETELFFDRIVREDRSILEFLTADETFINGRLARHYGIPDVDGDEFQLVSLRGTPRRGVLTHGSILALTSNPTRSSPVKRGKWVLDNLLNSPPPPPPPNVPELKEGKELTGTLRQRMEQHRADPLCASCHARLDPIGFALENFDGIGKWRDKEGDLPIDASGQDFNGPKELLALLATQKKDQFVRCLADKMLTYALGRGLERYDKCALDRICRNLAQHDYRFSGLVLEIVKSAAFQMRGGSVK